MENDVERVKELFKEADAANTCRTIANFYFQQAKKALEELSQVINQPEAEVFENLLDFVMKRKF